MGNGCGFDKILSRAQVPPEIRVVDFTDGHRKEGSKEDSSKEAGGSHEAMENAEWTLDKQCGGVTVSCR